MQAATASGPLDSSDHAYEVRWDGLRVLVGLEGNDLIARTGAGRDILAFFPELEGIREIVDPHWALLDGELIVTRNRQVDRDAIQRRGRVLNPDDVPRVMRDARATLVLYDILRIGDSWLLDVYWAERRDILRRAVRSNRTIVLSPVWPEGAEALRHTTELGLEAVVAKRLRGRYLPGERAREWLSIKPSDVVEAVIGGWTEGQGARSGTIGSLLLGMYQGGALHYVGHTGIGLKDETLQELHAALLERGRPACPFAEAPSAADPRWVRPEIVCRIRHQGWTRGRMRAPTFLELAPDVPPEQCVLPAGALLE